jgi:hypothetical protein
MTPADTLGDLVLSWMVRHLPSPRDERQPFGPAEWQMKRVRRWYELDATGKRCWTEVHDTDPKGKGKSPLAAATAIAEFRGPVHFAGWATGGEVYACEDGGCSCGWEYEYQAGEPMGVPWGTPGLPAPWVQVAAVSEAQTANTWAALHAFLAANQQQAARWLGLEAGRTLVYWRDRVDAKIERVTASAGTRTGQPITHAVEDEPQEWTAALHGPELAETIGENLTKMDGWAHFTGNAPVLGRGSVSEVRGYRQVDGRWERAPAHPRVLFLGVEPPETPREDMTRDEMRPLLRHTYEDTPWVPIERILDDAQNRASYPWPKVWRLFFNLPWDPVADTSWMPPDTWASRHGTVRLDPTEPAYTCVRIGHGHQHAAIVTAQVQSPRGRVALNKEGRPVLGEGDRVVMEIRTFAAAEGDWVSITDIEAALDDLRKRCPARVLGQVPVGTRGRLRDGHGHGPEIALAGAFTAGTHERYRSRGAIVTDIPSTPERLTPAAELLMQHVSRGTVVHDGDEETARQWANVTAKQKPKGWQPEAIDPSIPIVAPRAAMLALDRALNARRWKPSHVGGM